MTETVMEPREVRRYGWIPDLPDRNDFKFPQQLKAVHLPKAVDLRKSGFCSPIKDQGGLGSCTGNGIARIDEFAMRRQGQAMSDRSRLFIYYGEREIEHTVDTDSGAMIRDGLATIAKLGAPAESIWPYNIPAYCQKPPQGAYDDAQLHQAVTYHAVPNTTMRSVMEVIAGGTPVVIGFTVYEFFEQVSSGGVIEIPSDHANYGQVLGGHCVVIEGYEQVRKNGRSVTYATIANSWGDSWGDKGYCHFPLKWLCNRYNADDFWTLLAVE